jgi:hypothetical protein
MPALRSGVQIDSRKLGCGGGVGRPNSHILIRGISLITWYTYQGVGTGSSPSERVEKNLKEFVEVALRTVAIILTEFSIL